MNIKISCKIFVRFHAGAIALAALLALPVSPVFAATSISLTDTDVSNGVITLKNDNNADLAGNLSATETTPAISVKSTKGNNIVIEGSVGNVESIATTGTADAYGILAQTGGDITINLESGNITVGDAVAGRHGVRANTNTDTREGNIEITSGLAIDVASSNGFGIYGTANSGNVVVDNSGTITTATNSAIYASTVTGNVTIFNTGDLTSGNAVGASGVINASVSGTATTGTIKVNNNARIDVTGRGDLAPIRAYSNALEGNVEIFLGENSVITSNGYGIKGGLLTSNATGDMIITTRGGSIDMGSADSASSTASIEYGMYLYTQGGKRVVDIDGTNIHIWHNAKLNTKDGNYAVNAGNDAIGLGSGGDAYISIQNATIRSDVNSAIYANDSGNLGGSHLYIGYDADGVEVPLTGKFVSTYAQQGNAYGVIHAQTVNNDAGTGGIDISVGKAEIIANEKGDGLGVAPGIAAIKTTDRSGGDIHIKTSTDTTIETRGDNLSSAINGSTYGASGILARNAGNGNKIDIDNSATITTHGKGAKGIFAYSASGGVETNIRNAGDITTSGSGAHGIYVNGYSTGSVVDLVNAGTVSVNASDAYGIYVTNMTSGTVVNEGTVSNTATGGTAIRVEANNVKLVLAGGPASIYEDRAAQVVGNVVFTGSNNKLSLRANVQDIVGNLTFTSTSTFEVSARSLDDYQRLVVTGVSALAGATLVFDDTGVEALHNGDVFTLINGTGISGIFGGYNEGATYTSQGGNDYTISYLSGNVTLTAIVNAVAVPEPATCAVLAGLAMLMLAAARRGQRKRGQRG